MVSYHLIFEFVRSRKNRSEFAYTRLRTWCSWQLAHQWEENARLKSIRGRSGSLSREKKVQKNRGWKRRFTSGRWKYDKALALDHAVLHFDWMRWRETPKKTPVRLISAPIAGICMPISESRDVEPAKIAGRGAGGETRETRVTERQETRVRYRPISVAFH